MRGAGSAPAVGGSAGPPAPHGLGTLDPRQGCVLVVQEEFTACPERWTWLKRGAETTRF